MLVVGSKALNYRFPHLKRHVSDVDIIAYKDDANVLISELQPDRVVTTKWCMSLYNIKNRNEIFDKKNVEILLADTSQSLKKYLFYQKIKGGADLFACAEILFSLKKSHIHFPVKFHKHIYDYVFLNNYFSGKDILSEITKINFKETESRLGELKAPSLNKSVDNFFGQSSSFVKSYFIHDHIHQAVAHYNEPLYLKMQEDRTMAKCEKSLWELFTYEEKCKCVLEEAYVIALERRILPALFGGHKWFTTREALEWSLMRICTTLCSGWFRKFATDNYDRIVSMSDADFVLKFLEKVEKQEIKRI